MVMGAGGRHPFRAGPVAPLRRGGRQGGSTSGDEQVARAEQQLRGIMGDCWAADTGTDRLRGVDFEHRLRIGRPIPLTRGSGVPGPTTSGEADQLVTGTNRGSR